MDSVQPFHIAFSRAALCGAAAFFAACQAAPPRPTPERAISVALGIDGAITLAFEGAPLDSGHAGGATLPLAEALDRALHDSPELQASLARVRIALADADQARLLPNPVLDLILRLPDGGGKTSVEAGVSGDLLAVLQRPRRSDAADERLRSAVAESVSMSISVAAALQTSYAEVQALDDSTRLLRERRLVLGRLIELARARLDFGEASRLDVTTLEAQGVELDLEIAEREAERREHRLALARLVGRPSDDAAWTLDDWPALPDLASNEAQWLAVALDQRPEICAGRWELAALGDEAAVAGSSVLQGSGAGLAAQRDPQWNLGPSATVPLPLFDTGGARRDKAEAAIVEARHELVVVQRTVVEQVRRAYASYTAAKANLERMRTELIPLQLERRERAEGIYLAGHADVTAVLLAEQDLRAAQMKLVELQRKAVVSLVRLEQAVGGAGIAKRVGKPREGTDRETFFEEDAK